MTSPRLRFGFRRFIACVAQFGVLFAWMRQLGWRGIVIALITGSAFSLLILIARKRDLPTIANAYLWSLFGAFIGVGFLGGMHGPPDLLAAIVGVVLFWMIGCVALQSRAEARARKAAAVGLQSTTDEPPPASAPSTPPVETTHRQD